MDSNAPGRVSTPNTRVCVELETNNAIFTCFVEPDVANMLQKDSEYYKNFVKQIQGKGNLSEIIVTNKDADESVSTHTDENENIDCSDSTCTNKDSPDTSGRTDIRWSVMETELLVAYRIEDDQKFSMSKTHKQLWDSIAEKMQKHKYLYTGAQCMNKWKSLKREYKAVIDHNAKTGNDIKKCKFYEEFNQLYGNNPSTRPTFIMDTSTTGKTKSNTCTENSPDASSSNSDKRKIGEFQDLSPDTDDEKDDNEMPEISVSKKASKKVPGRKVKKSKSNQSNVDKMIDFMEKMQEKEEARQERHEDFIRKQNKEKLERFDRLLDVLNK